MRPDFYMSNQNVIKRLVKEWKKYGKIIVALDFDNTVYDFHGEGHVYEYVPSLIRECKKFGAHIVIFTASTEDRYNFIKAYLVQEDIPFDFINENPPDMELPKGGKLYYNILLDDRAGLKSAVYELETALRIMKEGE